MKFNIFNVNSTQTFSTTTCLFETRFIFRLFQLFQLFQTFQTFQTFSNYFQLIFNLFSTFSTFQLFLFFSLFFFLQLFQLFKFFLLFAFLPFCLVRNRKLKIMTVDVTEQLILFWCAVSHTSVDINTRDTPIKMSWLRQISSWHVINIRWHTLTFLDFVSSVAFVAYNEIVSQSSQLRTRW